MGSFHVTAWLQFYSGFCFLSGFKTYLWNKSFTDESLYSLFVLNKAYLLTISMFESLKFYIFLYDSQTDTETTKISVKQILEFILKTDSKSYFDVEAANNKNIYFTWRS